MHDGCNELLPAEWGRRIAGWRLVRTHAAGAARVLPRPATPRPLGAPLLAAGAPPDRRLLGASLLAAQSGRGRACRSVRRARPGSPSASTSRVAPAEKAQLRAIADAAGLPVAELVRLRALGRPVVSRTDATTIRELRRLGGLLKKVHVDSGGAYSEQTAAALATLHAAIARLAGRAPRRRSP